MRSFRVFLVGLALSATGALMGAAAGAVAGAIVGLAVGGREGMGFLSFMGTIFGAPLGAVLAPLAGFTFLRRVPLWRLFAEVTAGTIVGGVAGAFISLNPGFVLTTGIAGFLAATAWLVRRYPIADASSGSPGALPRPGFGDEVPVSDREKEAMPVR